MSLERYRQALGLDDEFAEHFESCDECEIWTGWEGVDFSRCSRWYDLHPGYHRYPLTEQEAANKERRDKLWSDLRGIYTPHIEYSLSSPIARLYERMVSGEYEAGETVTFRITDG